MLEPCCIQTHQHLPGTHLELPLRGISTTQVCDDAVAHQVWVGALACQPIRCCPEQLVQAFLVERLAVAPAVIGAPSRAGLMGATTAGRQHTVMPAQPAWLPAHAASASCILFLCSPPLKYSLREQEVVTRLQAGAPLVHVSFQLGIDVGRDGQRRALTIGTPRLRRGRQQS